MKKIYALTDYKGYFGLKYRSTPYRSGFDQEELRRLFSNKDFDLKFVKLSDACRIGDVKGVPVLYTSSEDIGYHYKSFIEDVVFSLGLRGANLIPEFRYLRANNNKSFMELLRKDFNDRNGIALPGWSFGTLDEMMDSKHEFTYPVVLKSSAGAMGSGVYLAGDENELIKYAKRLSHSPHFLKDIKDYLRTFKYKNYFPESVYRNKFVVQQFIPNLINDWKVYVFGEKFYVFYRPVFKHRKFKASGGGYENYFYGTDAKIPDGLLDFAKNAFQLFHVPHASFDIAYDGKKFFLLEFQFVYFGMAGILYSKEYFINKNGKWNAFENKISQEECYAESIIDFLNS